MDTLTNQGETLWLIDAADQVIEQLRLQAEALKQPVRIQQALVIPQQQQATFYEYNLPWANGPSQADESLHRLYPGLYCTRETQQQGLGIVDLVQQCLADADQANVITNNLLIIDLEQQTQALLQVLADNDQLQYFAQVLVVPPRQGQPLSLPNSLQAAHEPLPAGVPQNTQAYQVAKWVLERQQLQQQLAKAKLSAQKNKDWAHSLKQQLELSQQENNAKTEELAQARQQQDELVKQHETLLRQRDEQTKLANERQAQLQQRTQERDAKNGELLQLQQLLADTKANEKKHKDWANSLKQQLEQARQEDVKKAEKLRQAEQLQAELLTQCETLIRQRDEQTKQSLECQEQLQQRTQECDAKSAELAQLQQQLANTKTSEKKHKDWVHNLKQQLEQTRREDAAKAAELKQTEQQQAELLTQCGTLTRQRDELACQKSSLQSKLQQLHQDLDENKKKLFHNQKQLDEASANIKKHEGLSNNLQKKLNEIKEYTQKNIEIKEELDKQKSERKKLEYEHQKSLISLRNHKSSAEFFRFFDKEKNSSSPFLLIDSKSLPRSGLHYLKNTLSQLLGEQFSFCEWYQEPGCCKSNPCRANSYASYANKNNCARVRLIKSHDFELTDPYLGSSKHLQQIVLIREPIFILTSWFLLDQFSRYKEELLNHGVDIKKIYLQHEKEAVQYATIILDKTFTPPSDDQLSDWLNKKSQYISNFLDKWVYNKEIKSKKVKIINYNKINEFILDTIDNLQDKLNEECKNKIKAFSKKHESFKPRNDPFNLPSTKITEFVKDRKEFFIKASREIKF